MIIKINLININNKVTKILQFHKIYKNGIGGFFIWIMK